MVHLKYALFYPAMYLSREGLRYSPERETADAFSVNSSSSDTICSLPFHQSSFSAARACSQWITLCQWKMKIHTLLNTFDIAPAVGVIYTYSLTTDDDDDKTCKYIIQYYTHCAQSKDERCWKI